MVNSPTRKEVLYRRLSLSVEPELDTLPDGPELWRPVPEYEDLYEASNYGRVRSLDRLITPVYSRHIKGNPYHKSGRVLRKSKTSDGKGYMKVTLSRETQSKQYRVARVVASAFHGPIPEGYAVDHIDAVSDNDRPDNLRYVTPRENNAFSQGNRTRALIRKVAVDYRFLDANGVLFEGRNLKAFCEAKGLSSSNMNSVLRGKRRTHKGWTLAPQD